MAGLLPYVADLSSRVVHVVQDMLVSAAATCVCTRLQVQLLDTSDQNPLSVTLLGRGPQANKPLLLQGSGIP